MSNRPEADAYIDTDVIIRLLTGDDPKKQARAATLFDQVEKGAIRLAVPVLVIAEVVFVLSSPRLYHLPRTEVVGLLLPLLRLQNFTIQKRRTVFKALDLYLATSLSFTDAYIAASMQQVGPKAVYSYDRGYDRLEGIDRKEP